MVYKLRAVIIEFSIYRCVLYSAYPGHALQTSGRSLQYKQKCKLHNHTEICNNAKKYFLSKVPSIKQGHSYNQALISSPHT